MRIMKNHLRRLSSLTAVLATALAITAFVFPAQAQSAATNDNTNQTATATPTPLSAPTPIPISDVVSQAAAADKKLQAIQTSISASPGIQVVEDELPKLKQEIDARTAETTQLLSARPSLETLRQTEQDWQALAKDTPAWKLDLKTQLGVLDKQVGELENQSQLWQKTLDALENFQTPAQSNTETSTDTNVSVTGNTAIQPANTTQIPPEVFQRINGIINEIQQTQTQIGEQRASLLTLQTRVSEQETRVSEMLASTRNVREEALTHLFVQDSPAIWNAHRRSGSADTLLQETKDTFATQTAALGQYALRQSDRFALHGIILILLIGGLIWARQRVRPVVEKEPELERAVTIFKLPVVTALILSILLSGWLYPQAPRLLASLLGAAALIPVVILLRRLLEKPLFPILNALVIFYFVDRLRDVTASVSLVSRVLFLAEMLGGIIFFIWFLRSKRLARKIEAGHFHLFTLIKKAIPFVIAIFFVAFLANALGYVSLSGIIGKAILGSAYLALILYAAVQIVESLLIFAFRARPLSALRMVKEHRRLIRAKIFRILKWLAFFLWLILTLNLLSVGDAVYAYLRSIFTTEFAVGSLSISLGNVILFGLTVWLSFVISRFIRFTLAEDVYPRVNLAGGVPYAISTMLHYVVLIVGFIVALATLGFDLTKFTILAGAFGVGLGFGLQTIVNNFVSGLILLFERPVKVGDVVQLGEHQGDLSRIGLRASVLRTVEGSDVIVPNSQLISEKVINWTFSDQQRRIDVSVGVAYGNEPENIIKLLTKVALAHKDILKEPPPRTLFVGFGDNALNFQLRAWTNRTDQWVNIKSEIAVGVHKALRDAKVEIPFPQRDLNLKIVSPEAADILKSDFLKEDESKHNDSNSNIKLDE